MRYANQLFHERDPLPSPSLSAQIKSQRLQLWRSGSLLPHVGLNLRKITICRKDVWPDVVSKEWDVLIWPGPSVALLDIPL